jgi:ATP-dependent RNA helicase RhlE
MSQDIASFHDFKLNKQLINAIEEKGYAEPTPIQKKAIPLVLNGHDVIGIAQTGTGKTAAYVLPILMKLKYAQGNDPRGLILAPTRELAMQVYDNLIDLAKYTDLRVVCFYGGVGAKKQAEEVEQGCDIIVSTPGRFLDIYSKGVLHTKLLKTLVLDEADKMMDMGFMPQIRNILELVPMKKQNLFFSATFPPNVEKLAHEFTDFPEKVEVAPQATAVETIDQSLYYVPNFRTKVNLLYHLLKNEDLSRVMVFVKTKKTANNLFNFLDRKIEGEVRCIHANKAQQSRINAVQAFRDGEVRVLVTTDVTARGIDISMVTHVINFDIPMRYEDYVHRIGRTGRAQNDGEAFSFVTDADKYHIKKIEALIREKIRVNNFPEEVPIAETLKDEQKEMAIAIDNQKKREDPDYKGAFQEKKWKQRLKEERRGPKKRRKR